MELTLEERAYIDKFTAFATGIGIPRSVTRVLAYLMICQPERQTAEQIKHALKLSTGSVSNAMKMLVGIGLIEQLQMPGDRKFYYYATEDSWNKTLAVRVQALAPFRKIAEEGLQLDTHNKRLEGMRDFYAWCEREFADLARKLEQR